VTIGRGSVLVGYTRGRNFTAKSRGDMLAMRHRNLCKHEQPYAQRYRRFPTIVIFKS